MQIMLQSLSKQNESTDTDDPSGIYTPKADFWLELAVVGFDVPIADEVVEPVAPEFGDDCAGHGCEEEEGDGCVAEEVWWWFYELSYYGDDSDCPHCYECYETECYHG